MSRFGGITVWRTQMLRWREGSMKGHPQVFLSRLEKPGADELEGRWYPEAVAAALESAVTQAQTVAGYDLEGLTLLRVALTQLREALA